MSGKIYIGYYYNGLVYPGIRSKVLWLEENPGFISYHTIESPWDKLSPLINREEGIIEYEIVDEVIPIHKSRYSNELMGKAVPIFSFFTKIR